MKNDCSCPQCALARLHDRALIRMVGLVAFLCGGLVVVLRWAW